MTDNLKEPVLFNGKIDEDINFSFPPASGEEYIQRVILEAQKCDEVVCAKIDQTRLKQPTINLKPLANCTEAPSCFEPSRDWQEEQIANFSSIRMYITQMRDEIQIAKRKRNQPNLKVPDIDDESGWISFCSRTKEKEIQYTPPTLSNVLSLNQPTIEQVLEFLVEHIMQESKIDADIGQWLYALLVALEMPLNPSMCSCLRALARVCSTMRANLITQDPNDAVVFNLFICLVSRYFRQLDLADR